jgi:uncharacterized membrane protein YqjE
VDETTNTMETKRRRRAAALVAHFHAAVFLAGGCVLLGLAWARIKGLARMFAATRGELRRDRERLRDTPADASKKDDGAS